MRSEKEWANKFISMQLYRVDHRVEKAEWHTLIRVRADTKNMS